MSSIRCSKCNAHGKGKFCSQCGAALSVEIQCRKCANPIPEGGRFCNMCGTPAGAVAQPAPVRASSGGNLPWIVAGVALLGLAGVMIAPRLSRSEPAAPFAPAPMATSGAASAPGAGPANIDLSTMTPREAADRLFNRVMQSVSAGDSVQARTFAPMAISAYDMVPDIDHDGLYHLAVLHLVNGDAAAARGIADRILEEVPTHLFGLFTAAQAETLAGRSDAAGELYREFLARYGDEMMAGRSEYQEHAPVLPAMRQEAEQRAIR